ncbi:ThuA domain-containing protein [Aquimarina sp. RZ0]|uniref:ThuA domain-containing protein n=1 Tax=Aquimarina sp. RZ0 TaxID=2607730 RepID=UPI0011F0E78F|nr:ThuA domain-containing protein [Aquimarina sp. RZ0]KAA1244978.1 T9SS type A sorting domain-containing protein [Aquimarina sp. RZ0]
MIKKLTFLTTFVLFAILSQAQDRVLIFHKTNGFRHSGGINGAIELITDLGNRNGWETDNSKNASVFTDANLRKYDVVVWANTSGNNLLNGSQRRAFEKFISNGGGFVGIHAATDTYRNRSWPFYNELVGAIVQNRPNHTRNNLQGEMKKIGRHPITAHLGASWTKKEEWYYWDLNGGKLFPGNNVLLEVKKTGNKSYDRKRPITWYKNFRGGRSFYTALGHNNSDYKINSPFGIMLKNAIIWTGNLTTNKENLNMFHSDSKKDLKINSAFPNPTKNYININESNDWDLMDLKGTIINSGSGDRIDLSGYKSGMYLLKSDETILKIIKE